MVNREPASLELHAEPDGGLTFAVRDGEAQLEHHTQQIELSGPGWTILSVTWRSGSAELHLGGETLLSREVAGSASKLIRMTEHQVGVEPVWNDPEAASACVNWMKWRTQAYGGQPEGPRPGRRMKSGDEQAQDLSLGVQSLRDLSRFVHEGHRHLLGHLAVELRALVYWNGRNYDPLLLRLAARAGIPLPVYVIPDKPRPPAKEGLAIHVRRGEPSIVKTIPTQTIVDLQQWLTSRVLSERTAPNQGGAGELRHLTVKDLIAEVAETLGPAHYDQDVPFAIENLSRIEGPTADEVTLVLLMAASIVTELSEYVLASLQTGSRS
jgi:hypothetical protein